MSGSSASISSRSSLPFAASPTTSMPSAMSRYRRRPCRTREWSSAIATLIVTAPPVPPLGCPDTTRNGGRLAERPIAERLGRTFRGSEDVVPVHEQHGSSPNPAAKAATTSGVGDPGRARRRARSPRRRGTAPPRTGASTAAGGRRRGRAGAAARLAARRPCTRAGCAERRGRARRPPAATTASVEQPVRPVSPGQHERVPRGAAGRRSSVGPPAALRVERGPAGRRTAGPPAPGTAAGPTPARPRASRRGSGGRPSRRHCCTASTPSAEDQDDADAPRERRAPRRPAPGQRPSIAPGAPERRAPTAAGTATRCTARGRRRRWGTARRATTAPRPRPVGRARRRVSACRTTARPRKAAFDTSRPAPSGPTPGSHADGPDQRGVEREERRAAVVRRVPRRSPSRRNHSASWRSVAVNSMCQPGRRARAPRSRRPWPGWPRREREHAAAADRREHEQADRTARNTIDASRSPSRSRGSALGRSASLTAVAVRAGAGAVGRGAVLPSAGAASGSRRAAMPTTHRSGSTARTRRPRPRTATAAPRRLAGSIAEEREAGHEDRDVGDLERHEAPEVRQRRARTTAAATARTAASRPCS